MAAFLEVCNLTSYLKETMRRRCAGEEDLEGKEKNLVQIKKFFWAVLAGSMIVPNNEWEKFLSESPDLGEAAFFYALGVRILAHDDFRKYFPRISKEEDFVERIKIYLNLIELLATDKKWGI